MAQRRAPWSKPSAHSGPSSAAWRRPPTRWRSSLRCLGSSLTRSCADRREGCRPAARAARRSLEVSPPPVGLRGAAGRGRRRRGARPPIAFAPAVPPAGPTVDQRQPFEKRKPLERGFRGSGRRGSNPRHSAWEADSGAVAGACPSLRIGLKWLLFGPIARISDLREPAQFCPTLRELVPTVCPRSC